MASCRNAKATTSDQPYERTYSVVDGGESDVGIRNFEMRILQLSAQDGGGGAAEVARRLAESFKNRNHDCAMVVGAKRRGDCPAIVIPDRGGGPGAGALALRDAVSPFLGQVRGAGRLHDFLHCLGRPGRLCDRARGIEDFTLPASHQILDLAPWQPDIVHCHNLHSFRGPKGHFDLTALPAISEKVAVVLTLHDAWLTTGHCAHPVNCDRWRTGCGDCPDLDLYPPVRADATAENWRRKRDIFSRCRLYVASPCRWLANRVEQSMLRAAIIESRVIPNGVDLTIFSPGDRLAARRRLGLAEDVHILLFAAQGIRGKSYKDFPTLRRAVEGVAARINDRKVLFLALGEEAAAERAGKAEIRFIPYQSDPDVLADYYRAADLYLHAAKAETFPTAILEAMACGRPVVATAVGGIPEQINHERGVTVPSGDAEAMAEAAAAILDNTDTAKRMGAAAAKAACNHFDQEKQAESYLSWFREIIGENPG